MLLLCLYSVLSAIIPDVARLLTLQDSWRYKTPDVTRLLTLQDPWRYSCVRMYCNKPIREWFMMWYFYQIHLSFFQIYNYSNWINMKSLYETAVLRGIRYIIASVASCAFTIVGCVLWVIHSVPLLRWGQACTSNHYKIHCFCLFYNPYCRNVWW